MRRVPNRRGYIVMADTFTWFIKYCCIIDVFMRNERCVLASELPAAIMVTLQYGCRTVRRPMPD